MLEANAARYSELKQQEKATEAAENTAKTEGNTAYPSANQSTFLGLDVGTE